LSTKISPEGGYVLANTADGNDVSLFLENLSTGERLESPVATLVHKCAFLPEEPTQVVCGVPNEFVGAYPEDWLLGRAALNDTLWLVNFNEGSATLLADPNDEVGELIDVYNPAMDETGSYFYFLNKNDLSFWSFELNEAE